MGPCGVPRFRFRDARPSRFQRFQVPVPRRWPLICVTARFQVPVPAAAGGSRFQTKVKNAKIRRKNRKKPADFFDFSPESCALANLQSDEHRATFPTQTTHKGPRPIPCDAGVGMMVPRSTQSSICMDVTVWLFCCTPGWLAGGAGSHAACPCGAPGVEHEDSSRGATPAMGHGAAAR